MDNSIKKGLKYVIVFAVFIVSLIGLFYLSQGERLPSVGSDSGNWGDILNAYLLKEHTQNGSHKNLTTVGNVNLSNVLFVNPTYSLVTIKSGTSNASLDIGGFNDSIITRVDLSTLSFHTKTGASPLYLRFDNDAYYSTSETAPVIRTGGGGSPDH